MTSLVKKLLVSLCLIVYLTSCTPASTITEAPTVDRTTSEERTAAATVVASRMNTLTPTDTISSTVTPSPSATPDERLDPADWQNWQVVPTVSARAKAIYTRGQKEGNYPERFSKIGDCQNINTYFLDFFDDPESFNLGEDYAYLQEAVDYFSGSFSRQSAATRGGLNVAAVVSTSYFWLDSERCNSGESSLTCELRLHQPSIALISMEESWGRNNQVENYEKYMRQIIETVIEFGTVPILATKADNVEGDHQVNQVIARLAYEYDIPLWNFWRAVQPLPHHGLLNDGFHLTHGINDFSESRNLKQAWPVRNLTALQVIDSVWRQLNDLPLPPQP